MGLVKIYLAIVNVVAFVMMGVDKSKAKRHRWRISELALFAPAVLFGSLGSLIGMFLFHHKTHKPKFLWGVPVSLIVQIIIVIIAFSKFA